jgi:hypothetical protein
MPTVLQFRRGTTAQNNSFTGSAGELSIDTTLDTVRVHDGSTAGGFEITQNTATQTLTNKTLTSPTITGVSPTITLGGDLSGSATLTDLGSATLTATVGILNQSTTGSAATLTTPRAIQVSGAVTGTADFDGSAAINIVTTNTADPTITLTGAVTGSGTLTNLGNVSIATTNTADPTITLAGDLSGSATLTNLGDATLTATIAANSVALGTDTTGNYVATATASGAGISGSVSSEGGTFSVVSNGTSSNVSNTLVYRDGSGNFSAGTITALATSAQYADVAENFKVNEQADAGTVMVFNKDGLLVICNSYADSMLVGVISTDPAYLLNSDQPDGQPIALAGQVPCKVVGPVKVGDLLTTSNTPGYATVLELNDWKPGITVGKAMENCSTGKHTIKVFVGAF